MPASSAQNERLTIIGGLIEDSRRLTSASRLGDEELGKTAQSWEEIIADIPTADLRDCYRESMQERQVRGAFLPQEILTVWRSRRKPAPVKTIAVDCGICEGTGYQLIVVFCPTIKRENTRARPCGCSAAPANQARSPLKPPEWVKRKSDGAWTAATGDGLQCTCFGCERTGKFSRRNLMFDSTSLEDAPVIR